MLDLGCNKIGVEAVKGVVEALRSSLSSLRFVALDGNIIGEKGGKLVASGLEDSRALERVMLGDGERGFCAEVVSMLKMGKGGQFGFKEPQLSKRVWNLLPQRLQYAINADVFKYFQGPTCS